MSQLFIPIKKLGKMGERFDVTAGAVSLRRFDTGDVLASLGQSVGGEITLDMRKYRGTSPFSGMDLDEVQRILSKAADQFMNGTLDIAGGRQSPDEFVTITSLTTGTPEVIVRRGMEKCAKALRQVRDILRGLASHSDLGIDFEDFWKAGTHGNYSLHRKVLGALLPNNAIGVHTLWLALIPLLRGLVLKPGTNGVWVVLRLYRALVQAGVPEEFFGFYPTDSSGLQGIVTADAAMVFGGWDTLKKAKGNPKVEGHGPGFSKIVIGDDMIHDVLQNWDSKWEALFIESIDGGNSGRSCLCASGIWCSDKNAADEIAARLALALNRRFVIRKMTDPEANLTAFTGSGDAQGHWDNSIKPYLVKYKDTVREVTEAYGPRVQSFEHHSFLLPTVLRVDDPSLKISQTELLGHFVTVVVCPQAEMVERMEHTLVAMAITGNTRFYTELDQAPLIDQVHEAEVPTTRLKLGSPHEGNGVNLCCSSGGSKHVFKADMPNLSLEEPKAEAA